MLRHKDIWNAIDKLAKAKGYSASGLARRAGLDPTSFNKSKRVNPQGKPRWPTTESIAKVLEVTDLTLSDFVTFAGAGAGAGKAKRYPLVGLAKAGDGGYFDDSGFPTGTGWAEIDGPDVGDDGAYALEITGDSMAPVFRPGDIVIVSPSSQVKRGDRVIVKTTEDEVMAKELIRHTKREIELKSVNDDHPDPIFRVSEIRWMHRIVWASQ
ncbi:MAG: DNA-binding protein [Rhodospirillaceae bacterium]|nr:DNA-binding protein [Rhodospirillaceae bacterium]|tara:strand:+ start:61954 stop:62586 length:633 start_codon:yes stop_codon:yes gene_type:complete